MNLIPNQTVFFRFLTSACDRGKPFQRDKDCPETTVFSGMLVPAATLWTHLSEERRLENTVCYSLVIQDQVRKRGLLRKLHFLEILENFEIPEMLESFQIVENRTNRPFSRDSWEFGASRDSSSERPFLNDPFLRSQQEDQAHRHLQLKS